jgi:hypothetical protein
MLRNTAMRGISNAGAASLTHSISDCTGAPAIDRPHPDLPFERLVEIVNGGQASEAELTSLAAPPRLRTSCAWPRNSPWDYGVLGDRKVSGQAKRTPWLWSDLAMG